MTVRFALAALLVLPLAACASRGAEEGGDRPGGLARLLGADADVPNAGPCPLLGVLYDNSRIVTFAQPGQERLANVTWTGEVLGVSGLCRYIGADPITMNLNVDMAFGRGPAAQGAEAHTYRYWVAVTRRDIAPITREYFDVTVEFPRGRNTVTRRVEIERIVIPRANDTISGANFEILVGFDLTPEQLEFNRQGKRFRLDAGGEG